MVLPETALRGAPTFGPAALDEQTTGASGTRYKVATRPATVGITWLDLFHPGTPSDLSLEARVRVISDVAGALVQIHENSGLPRPHRRHGRVTPRHVLIGVDGSASLFNAKEPFSKLLPPQPDLGYLSPELLTQSGPADQQSDVFSLGVLLWEALDNGRLFPHRRAASISRLIARRSLPSPRIEDEVALPLAEVALKALSQDPQDRYADATQFWLALREHLPAPDGARATLARVVQRALRLEMTSEIREAPPYLPRRQSPVGASLSPASLGPLDALSLENSARYSLRPEPSSRAPREAARVPAALRSSAVDSMEAASSSVPPLPLMSSAAPLRVAASAAPTTRIHSAARSAPVLSEVPVHPDHAPIERTRHTPPFPLQPYVQPRVSAPPHPEPPVATLQVNLPRDLVDVALPYYVSSKPPPRPFPWGALSFAALIFFGVGAAVAFGAVTALRTVPARAPLDLTPERTAIAAAPPSGAPEKPPDAPNRPAAERPIPAELAPSVEASHTLQAAPQTPDSPALAPLDVAPSRHSAPGAAPQATSPQDAMQHLAPRPENSDAQRKVARRVVAKPTKPKTHVAPKPADAQAKTPAAEARPQTDEAKPKDDDAKATSDEPADNGLPFVEQPY
jgi:serine/threonine protein kinase